MCILANIRRIKFEAIQLRNSGVEHFNIHLYRQHLWDAIQLLWRGCVCLCVYCNKKKKWVKTNYSKCNRIDICMCAIWLGHFYSFSILNRTQCFHCGSSCDDDRLLHATHEIDQRARKKAHSLRVQMCWYTLWLYWLQ